MNNEIKEILDYLKIYFELRPSETELLLDYITNLQERNEKAIEFVEQNLEGIGYVEVCDLLNILQGEDKDE